MPEHSPKADEPARRLRVTLTQWHATRDVAANLRKALELVRDAGPDKPDLILLPENGLMIGTNDEMRAAALGIDSPEIDQLRSQCQQGFSDGDTWRLQAARRRWLGSQHCIGDRSGRRNSGRL